MSDQSPAASVPPGWTVEDVTPERLAEEAAVLGSFTESLRELVDLAVRTDVDLDVVRRAHARLEEVNALLRARTIPGSYGVRVGPAGTRAWGNAMIGLRNATAPPLDIRHDGVGRAWCDLVLGAAYEGPPTLVHGGVTALVLDHVFGSAAGADGRPRMTGTLTLRYRRGTPLGKPRAEAWVESRDGRKSVVRGHLADEDGPTVEAEGLFILPRGLGDS